MVKMLKSLLVRSTISDLLSQPLGHAFEREQVNRKREIVLSKADTKLPFDSTEAR